MTLGLPFAFDENTLHLGEFLPPLLAGGIYVPLYLRRVLTLRREGRPVPGWRVASFISAVVVLVVVQVPPLDTIADEVLLAHMIQHILIGEICSLFIVLGLTGTMLAPLMRMRIARPLRVMANPLVAFGLWTLDLYLWHLPLFYQLAIRHDVIHALEHACLLWFGVMLWMGLLGPLPKPAWFEGWGRISYVIGVRFVGSILGNVFVWTQTVLYPVYTESDARRGLNPVSDQNLAGGAMMIVQMILTAVLLVLALPALRDPGRGTSEPHGPRRRTRHRAHQRARAASGGGGRHGAAAPALAGGGAKAGRHARRRARGARRP